MDTDFSASPIIIVGAIIGGLAAFILHVLFVLSLYRGLSRVPKEKLLFPAGLVWLLLVPIANLVFVWLMIPFGVPKSFERAVEGRSEAAAKAKTLFTLGLAYAILVTLCLLPFLAIFAFIPVTVVWIIYWLRAVEFRKRYLENNINI